MFRFQRSNGCAIIDEKPFCIIKILFLLLASMWSEKNGSLAIRGKLSKMISILTPTLLMLLGEFFFFLSNSHLESNQVEYKQKIGSKLYEKSSIISTTCGIFRVLYA